jgi:hypothetical protein
VGRDVFLANADLNREATNVMDKKEPTIWVGPYSQKEWLDDGSVESESSERKSNTVSKEEKWERWKAAWMEACDKYKELYESPKRGSSNSDDEWEDSDDESSGPPSLVDRKEETDSDSEDESVNSVETVSAATLLQTCTTNLDDVSVNEEEENKAIKEVDVKDWKPPFMCTRSKKYMYANPYGMTLEEVREHNKSNRKKSRDDSKFDDLYQGADKLIETLKQVANSKAEIAKQYGVDDLDDYLHQRAMEWGLEREVDIHDATNEAEDEEVYFQVKPKKKRGINRLVKIVHKRNKSM